MIEIKDLITKLAVNDRGCDDQCVDLKNMRFDVKDGESRLVSANETLHFKKDPKNPKDPKVTHAAKQFCSIIGVPFSFFLKNPEAMKSRIAELWMSTLKQENSTVLIKTRTRSGAKVIRAVLPVEFTNVPNSDIVTRISDAVKEDYRIEFMFGDEPDDLVLHIRYLSSESFTAYGETCSCGFSVVVSELGASPLSIQTLLFREPSSSSFLANYNGDPFFENDYEKLQPQDLKDLFPQIVIHLKEKLPDIKDRIQSSKEIVEKKDDIMILLKDLRLKKGLSERFHRLLMQELDSDSDIKTLWDFSNKVAVIAKEFEVKERIKIERVAGELINLNFSK